MELPAPRAAAIQRDFVELMIPTVKMDVSLIMALATCPSAGLKILLIITRQYVLRTIAARERGSVVTLAAVTRVKLVASMVTVIPPKFGLLLLQPLSIQVARVWKKYSTIFLIRKTPLTLFAVLKRSTASQLLWLTDPQAANEEQPLLSTTLLRST
jgi:hypothetical protein